MSVNVYSCDKCPKIYRNKHSLHNHHKQDHEEPSAGHSYECQICNKTYTVKARFLAHCRGHTHHFECTICGHTTATSTALKTHTGGHRAGKFFCLECHKFFDSEQILDGHIASCHPKPFKVEVVEMEADPHDDPPSLPPEPSTPTHTFPTYLDPDPDPAPETITPPGGGTEDQSEGEIRYWEQLHDGARIDIDIPPSCFVACCTLAKGEVMELNGKSNTQGNPPLAMYARRKNTRMITLSLAASTLGAEVKKVMKDNYLGTIVSFRMHDAIAEPKSTVRESRKDKCNINLDPAKGNFILEELTTASGAEQLETETRPTVAKPIVENQPETEMEVFGIVRANDSVPDAVDKNVEQVSFMSPLGSSTAQELLGSLTMENVGVKQEQRDEEESTPLQQQVGSDSDEADMVPDLPEIDFHEDSEPDQVMESEPDQLMESEPEVNDEDLWEPKASPRRSSRSKSLVLSLSKKQTGKKGKDVEAKTKKIKASDKKSSKKETDAGSKEKKELKIIVKKETVEVGVRVKTDATKKPAKKKSKKSHKEKHDDLLRDTEGMQRMQLNNMCGTMISVLCAASTVAKNKEMMGSKFPQAKADQLYCVICENVFRSSRRSYFSHHIREVHSMKLSSYLDLLQIKDSEEQQTRIKAERDREMQDRLSYKAQKYNKDTETLFKCPGCPQLMTAAPAFRIHITSAHAHDSNYADIVKEAELIYDRRLRRANRPDVPIDCAYCGEEKIGMVALKAHMSMAHYLETNLKQKVAEKQEQYKECYKKFRRDQYHKNIHEHRSTFKCNFCPDVFAFRSSRARHMKYSCDNNPDRQKLLTCSYCERRFETREALETHRAAHKRENYQHVCEECGLVRRTRAGLYQHKKIHHSKGPGKYACTGCEKRFHTRERMEKHLTVHSDERSFTCEMCGNHYKTKAAVYKHQRAVHFNKYKYNCEKCGHGMQKKSYLKVHVCGRIRRNQATGEIVAHHRSKPTHQVSPSLPGLEDMKPGPIDTPQQLLHKMEVEQTYPEETTVEAEVAAQYLVPIPQTTHHHSQLSMPNASSMDAVAMVAGAPGHYHHHGNSTQYSDVGVPTPSVTVIDYSQGGAQIVLQYNTEGHQHH